MNPDTDLDIIPATTIPLMMTLLIILLPETETILTTPYLLVFKMMTSLFL